VTQPGGTSGGGRQGVGAPARVFGIGSAVTVMVGAVLLAGRMLAERESGIEHPAATVMASPGDPIAAEAGMFRTAPGDVATPAIGWRREVHPRTLAITRTLRAYPGAPPRVPHGLTADEFRDNTCNVCHERGGYAARFSSYAPVTPHPEYRACLQCHAVEDAVVGVVVRDRSADDVCLQCHVPGAATPPFVPLDWRPAAWPATSQRALEGSPPLIPHDFHMRTNCVACHIGPGGVQEVRTTHPERSNCRQCHVPAAPEAGEFSRPGVAGDGGPGGGF
jgi:cytochrome c-type protein NapB